MLMGMGITTVGITMAESTLEMAALARLLQLASPSLPVGGYSYSQTLEQAVEQGWVTDERSARDWIGGLLEHILTNLDLPVLCRLYVAHMEGDLFQVHNWSSYLLASRESFELRDEDRNMGQALAKLLTDLGMETAGEWVRSDKATFATLFTLACQRWNISLPVAANSYLWIWLENQVAAAIKLIPLGQTSGQRLLMELAGVIPETVDAGIALEDDEIGASAPAFAIASAFHETQYCRLFRS